ncbi:MAG: diguanylate cyclase [Magnetococcales bacterium]|nr:diguanylate cyclase [Magnetococcales bacterium]
MGQNPFEELYDLLRTTPPSTAEALALAKRLLVQDPCAPSVSGFRDTLVEVLERLVLPCLEGDRDRQTIVSHLARDISRRRQLEKSDIAKDLQLLAKALTSSTTPSTMPDGFPSRLLTTLQTLGGGDPEVANSLERLEASLTAGLMPWNDLNTFCGEVVARSDLSRDLWRHERIEWKRMLMDLAQAQAATGEEIGLDTSDARQQLQQVQEGATLGQQRELKETLLRDALEIRAKATTLARKNSQDSSELQTARKRIAELEAGLAVWDNLLRDTATGLVGRAGWMALLDAGQSAWVEQGRHLVVLVCRWAAADGALLGEKEQAKVLKALVDRLKPLLDVGEVAGRLGPDTLGVLLPGASEEEGLERAESLAKAVSRLRFRLAGQTVGLFGGCGMAVLGDHPPEAPPGVLPTPEELFHQAWLVAGERIAARGEEGLVGRVPHGEAPPPADDQAGPS